MVTSPLPGSIGGSMERPLFERSLTACVLLGVVWWLLLAALSAIIVMNTAK